MTDVWKNQPSTSTDFNQLCVSLKEKGVKIKHYIGNFGFDWTDTYAYYLTPSGKLMRVKTTWEPSGFGSYQKIHWDETTEF